MVVPLSWDGTTPGESFCPGIERLQGGHSFRDRKIAGETFCPGIDQLQGSHSVLG